MLSTALRSADRQAEHHRHADLPIAHIVHLGSLVHYLVHRAEDEIAILHFSDRPHADHGGTYCGTDDCALGDRRIDDPAASELLGKA